MDFKINLPADHINFHEQNHIFRSAGNLTFQGIKKEVNMMNSKEIAKLIGPTISVMTLSEVINFHIWATNIPPVTYLNGILLFVAGISILRIHNRWVFSWPLLVTLVGWFGILGGLFRIFFPEAKQAEDNTVSYVVIFFLFAVGIFLTFKAFSRDNK